MIHYLLLPSERYIEFPFWCLVRLFDEAVKNNYLSSDHGAEKSSSNSFFCLGADLKEATAKRPCMRNSQVGPYSSMRTDNARNRARKPTGQVSSSASTVSL